MLPKPSTAYRKRKPVNLNSHVNKEVIKINELDLKLQSLEKENELNKKTGIGKCANETTKKLNGPNKYTQELISFDVAYKMNCWIT